MPDFASELLFALAALEVKIVSREKAAKAPGKHSGPAAEAIVKMSAAQDNHNGMSLRKTQMSAFGRQEKLLKEEGAAFTPPESKTKEEAKLLEV